MANNYEIKPRTKVGWLVNGELAPQDWNEWWSLLAEAQPGWGLRVPAPTLVPYPALVAATI